MEGRSAFHKASELLVEARQTPAAVHQLLLAAGPGRVRGGVDVERHLLSRRAIGGARPVGGAVVQLNFDKVIVGVNALFHGRGTFRGGPAHSDGCPGGGGLYGRGPSKATGW